MNWLCLAGLWFLLLFLLLRPICFAETFRREVISIAAAGRCPLRISAPHFEYFCTIREGFSTTLHMTSKRSLWKMENWLFLGTEIQTALEQTSVFLDAKGLWKPGQNFILAGFTLSLPRSASCGTGQTTIYTGCHPSLLRNCVDHPTDCNSF